MKEGRINQYCPTWIAQYRWPLLPQDLLAGVIVAIMLVPQSMAYALVADLPPQYGMYASILPLLAYAAFGSSMTLAVGPVAVTSLMTAAALTPLLAPGSAEYAAAAAVLALMSGGMLLVFGVLRFGFLAKLLSSPIISGFTSGASLLIAIGQLNPLLGITTTGEGTLGNLIVIVKNISTLHRPTAVFGCVTLVILVLTRQYAAPLLRYFRVHTTVASLFPKLIPMLVVMIAIVLASTIDVHSMYGVRVVGTIPQGLPSLQWPQLSGLPLGTLLFPAFAIGLINFVSSISVALSLAQKRQQKVSADAELRGLGAANIASALSGGFPVNGGFARSLVSFSAGAQTPLAGIISALLMAVVVANFTDIFTSLPVTVLAATIIIAVVPVIDIGAFWRTWQYDRADALALAATAIGVVILGVEAGIAIGIGVSLASLVWRSSNPHIAVLGRVPFTEHFRNVLRYKTETLDHVLALRIDENLLFANALAVEQRVRDEVAERTQLKHVLVVLSSVSQVDSTALEMLIELNQFLQTRGIDLNFAEVKGPVLRRLENSLLLKNLTGSIFLSTHQAFQKFSGEAEDYSI